MKIAPVGRDEFIKYLLMLIEKRLMLDLSGGTEEEYILSSRDLILSTLKHITEANGKSNS